MKTGKPTAVGTIWSKLWPWSRGNPRFNGRCRSPVEHFSLAVDNRDLQERVGALDMRVQFLTSVLECTSSAVIVAGTDGIISMFNPGAEEIFQMESSIAIGDNLFRLCTDFVNKDPMRQGERQLVDTFMQEEAIKNMRIEFIGQEGKVTPCLFALNFVLDDKGNRIAIVAVIKDNSEVEELMRTDPLTGLANRRQLVYMIERECERVKRGMYDQVSIVFFDVDDFGVFNKRYGHQVGDDVLRMVGEVTQQEARWIDTAGKYGGEEFVVVMPGTDPVGASKLAERIRVGIASSRVPTEEHGPLAVTVSLGIQTYSCEDEGDWESLVKHANTAMLIAKVRGKNRCLQYVPSLSEELKSREEKERKQLLSVRSAVRE